MLLRELVTGAERLLMRDDALLTTEERSELELAVGGALEAIAVEADRTTLAVLATLSADDGAWDRLAAEGWER